jgi:hypothetical protein
MEANTLEGDLLRKYAMIRYKWNVEPEELKHTKEGKEQLARYWSTLHFMWWDKKANDGEGGYTRG